MTAYLKSLATYQIGKKKPKQVNKKQFATAPNKSFNIDLIDFNQYVSKNRQYRFIMTVVDTFSEFVFIERLKNKDAETVKNAFQHIVETKASGYPSILYSDNGLEFANEKLSGYCDEHGIKQIFTPTYTPLGLVESTNGIIRQIIRALFLQTGTLNWSDHINEIERNINDRASSSTGKSRKEIYDGLHTNEVRERTLKTRQTFQHQPKILWRWVKLFVFIYLDSSSSDN